VAGTYTLLSNSPYTDIYKNADHSNSSIYQVTSGAWVFAAGTMYWNWGLDSYTAPSGITTYAVAAPSAALQATTANILNLFVSGGVPNSLPGPTNLTATATTTSVTLAWQDNTTAATAYSVERSTDGSTWSVLTASLAGDATGYTDNTPGSWYYRVRASDNSGHTSSYSNVVHIATVPTAPTSLGAVASTTTLAINLSWTDTSVTETAYVVERSADGGATWGIITSTLPANTQAYADTSVAPLTPYAYRVRATNGTVSSAYSNVANATSPNGPPPPLAPTGLAASIKGNGGGQRVTLTWKNNATNATNNVVERSTNQTTWTRLTSSLSASATSYTDSSVARRTRYYYRVGAINATNTTSPSYSNIASAATT
jgi:hypothetical protein